ncbi:glutaredoxin 2 isoform X1 [Megalobrama amblycephala]|uniref:glutaredoxin 2 isoform X1 n=2 Tax=Megalobrama amblycephala TaxID=75352 RepID=UPI00201430C1|nr:glutaredoxin 2 isoform X1 [Megalobrama amblycephala]
MTDLNCQSNSLVSALTAFAFLVSSTCLFYRPVIITRMGNFTSSAPGLSSSACNQFVQDVVSSNCVVIFSKTTCPYCKMAKNVFNEIGATYKVVELDEHNDGRRLQETLAQMTGARTVPRVFINGQCIGGGSDTKQLHQQGKLLPLIEQCHPCCLSTSPDGSGNGQQPNQS